MSFKRALREGTTVSLAAFLYVVLDLVVDSFYLCNFLVLFSFRHRATNLLGVFHPV